MQSSRSLNKQLVFLLFVSIFAGMSLIMPRLLHKTNTILSPTPSVSPTPLVTPEIQNSLTYIMEGKSYQASWITINKPKNISLRANFLQQRTSSQFYEKESCGALINGGFYTTTHEPIGLFVENGKEIHQYAPNNTLNGFFSIAEDQLVTISRQSPSNFLRVAIQSGPLLWEKSQALPLAIRDDEPARRIVVATTKQHTVLFIVFHNPDSPHEGPLLSDLPVHIKEFQTKTGIPIEGALNLDGGSASAFITDNVRLEELTPVGSFFCIAG